LTKTRPLLRCIQLTVFYAKEAKMRKFSCFIIIASTFFCTASYAGFYGEKYCATPGFHCEKIKKSTLAEMIWTDARESEIVKKINRVHKWLQPGSLILIPDNMAGKTYMDFSPFPKTFNEFRYNLPNYISSKFLEQSNAYLKEILSEEKIVIWVPEMLAWAAYEKGKLINWGPALGGANRCEGKAGSCKTPSGIFEALEQKGVGHHSDLYPRGCKGKDCSWMPYSVKVRGDGLSMHGSKWFIGRHASHGCVRLFTKDAKWLNQKFFDYKTKKNKGTKIVLLPY